MADDVTSHEQQNHNNVTNDQCVPKLARDDKRHNENNIVGCDAILRKTRGRANDSATTCKNNDNPKVSVVRRFDSPKGRHTITVHEIFQPSL